MNYLEGISFVPTTNETRREKKSKKKKKKKKKKHKKKIINNNLNVNLNNSSSGESNDEDNNINQEKQLYHITKQPPPQTLSFDELLAKANGTAPISSISSQPPQTLSFEELLAKAKDDNNPINNNNNINSTRISPIISSRRNNIRKHESIQPSKLDPNKAAAEAIKRQLLGLEPTNTPTNEEYNDDAPPATNNPMNNPRLFKKRKAELIEQRKLHHLNHDNNQQQQKNNNMKTNSIMSNRFHKEGETFDPANARGTSISSNTTSSDLDSIFIKNVLKRGKRFKGLMMETGGTGDQSTELDMSLFTDNRTNSQKQNAIRSNAGRNQQRYNQIVQHDQYNINNNRFPKHLIISMNQYAYLMLPRNKPITNGHCLIVPLQPIKSMTQADNDLNNEIANYKHSLLQMFHHEKRSCIFLETVMNINRSHHTLIHCIPIEDDIAEESPIHFQQAILNSDTEWSSHKKIINTSHANHINQAIPPNFSYFHVEICHVKKPKVGYGHIIEDAKKFSPYFGQDVVNDLLGNPPSRFGRKEDKRLNFNAQRDLVIKFKQSYCKYDVVGEEKKKGGD